MAHSAGELRSGGAGNLVDDGLHVGGGIESGVIAPFAGGSAIGVIGHATDEQETLYSGPIDGFQDLEMGIRGKVMDCRRRRRC